MIGKFWKGGQANVGFIAVNLTNTSGWRLVQFLSYTSWGEICGFAFGRTFITLPDKYYKMLKSSLTLWERIMAMKYQTWDSHGFFTPGPIAKILTFNRTGNI
jgi:hypothetical protein